MGLARFIKPYKFQFTIGSIAKLTEAILEVYLPILMAKIIDNGILSADHNYIIKIGLQMMVLVLFGFACAGVCQYFAAVTSQGTGASIRNELVRHISTFSYNELDNFGTSTLINRITSDVDNYQQAVALTMRLLTRAPFICIGAIVMSLSINRSLALIFIILLPILALVSFWFMRYTSPLFKKAQKKLDRFALTVRENLSGIRVIRAFATTTREKQRAYQHADETCSAYTNVGQIFAAMQPINSILLNISIVLLLYFGASKILTGNLSQGDILSLTIYATKILYSVAVMANLIVVMTKASVSGQRISEVFETNSSISDVDTLENITDLKTDNIIEFNDVDFGYKNADLLLKNISFNMKRGNTLGIVGVTGSGKSTLLSLLQRFYDTNRGQILFDGIEIKNYSFDDLRGKIGIVPQNNILFSGTISDNMRISSPIVSDEQIEFALKAAQCWDFVSNLKDGINSPIFEGGKNFSGGQKQRLTIARALVRNPELLLLDDSLSALDYKTDLALRNSLKENYVGLSTIIVSQRISSVISADNIIVIDHGELVGAGSHDQLLNDCPTYQEIYLSQTSLDEKGA